MTNKYEITDITHPIDKRLHRIRALRDIPNAGVKAGDLGGWVENERNLSQLGDSWVGGNARIFGDAHIYGNAGVFDEAVVFEDARIYGNARVFDKAEVFEDAQVFGKARVFEGARIFGEVRIFGNARIYGDARAYDLARVCGQARAQDVGDILYARIVASDTFGATLYRTADGHDLQVGCWDGTVSDFRTMIESDEWVEATPEQIELRRPELLAFADMCEARIATWGQ